MSYPAMTPIPVSRRPARHGLARLARVMLQPQSYRNILYLLAAFPLGLLYFVMLVTGLSVGFGTAVLGVGVLILVLMLEFTRLMAGFERGLVQVLLRVPIATPIGSDRPDQSSWRRIAAHLRHPMTWKSLAYLLVEFPFGVLSFSLAISLLSLSLGLLLVPVAYLADTAVVANGDSQGVILLWVQVTGQVDLWPLLAFLAISVLGLFVTIGSLYALNGLAYAWGQFARLMLGTSATQLRLAEARATAVHERTRAEQADRRRRELIVNVSHELRTPIASIRGHVESLQMAGSEQQSDAGAQSYLGTVAREAERLSALVDDLLALARADADELHLDVRPVAVGSVIDEVYNALASLAHRDRRVSVVRNVVPDLPDALADRDRLAQVLLNLARNAITATPEGGLVFIDLERHDDTRLALTVSDTGSGIPPEDLERVFERFYRTDASRSRATGGFGLGLSIVRDLVQAMGGTVTVSSTVGAGSCFRVLLRAASGPAQPG